MNEAELNKRFDDIHELLKALRENVELLNRIGVSFNALIDLLLAKKVIEADELLPEIEARLKEYKKSKAERARRLKEEKTGGPISPN